MYYKSLKNDKLLRCLDLKLLNVESIRKRRLCKSDFSETSLNKLTICNENFEKKIYLINTID